MSHDDSNDNFQGVLANARYLLGVSRSSSERQHILTGQTLSTHGTVPKQKAPPQQETAFTKEDQHSNSEGSPPVA